MIKYGMPVVDLKYKTIEYIAIGSVIINIWILLYSILTFVSAIQTKINVGNYINMVSANDGNVLSTLLVIPGILCIPLNAATIYALYRAFSKEKQRYLNIAMFAFVMISIGVVFIALIICIMVLSHAYSSNEELHDGIIDAMNNYSSNSLLKMQIDKLQIQFDCCGSKHYNEWYGIQWYDTNLIKKTPEKQQTPFSCCSIQSIDLCIHHGIESSSSPYRYSKDVNFSISTNGCFTKIKEKKKSVGWMIIRKIMFLLMLQTLTMAGVRFVQTAHFEKYRFDDEHRKYLCWLFGKYTGNRDKAPPPVPPVPKELMD